MRFSGRHVGAMRGFAPTGREVSWTGAALFRFEGGAIEEPWVLGGPTGLEEQLTTASGAA